MPLPGPSKECPFCQGHIMGDRPGRNCSTTYSCGASNFTTTLATSFNKSWAVHDITSGVPGVMVESYPGLAKYVWTRESASGMSNFLGSWFSEAGFDVSCDSNFTHLACMSGLRTYMLMGSGVPIPIIIHWLASNVRVNWHAQKKFE